MAQHCTVCSHPQREAIETALVRKVTKRTIADQFGLSPTAVQRHKQDHLPQVLAAAQAARPVGPGNRTKRTTQPDQPGPELVAAVAADAQRGVNVLAQLERCFERVNKLFDACDAWLTDPDDPTRYTLDPRASDVSVIYEVLDEEGTVTQHKRGRLSWLVAWVQHEAAEHGHRVRLVETETKIADPRKLVLDAAGQLRGQLEFLVEAMERVRGVQELEAFVEDVVAAIGEADDATRVTIVAALQRRHGVATAPRPARGR